MPCRYRNLIARRGGADRVGEDLADVIGLKEAVTRKGYKQVNDEEEGHPLNLD